MALLFIAWFFLELCSSTSADMLSGRESPVTKVVKMLQAMSSQVEAADKEDEAVYGKMHCWCKTNDAEKTAAIEAAEKSIEELTAQIEAGSANADRLTSELEALKAAIADGQNALQSAAALRESERSEFEAEEEELNATVATLSEAILVLQKVQLVQSDQKRAPTEDEALAQVRRLVSRTTLRGQGLRGSSGHGPRKLGAVAYRAVMQKDIWDLLGTLPGASRPSPSGMVQQPTGAAAGAKSYNSRSGNVLGLLAQMKESFEKDLAAAIKEETVAREAYERLKSAKEGEVEAAVASSEEKTASLADTKEQVAQAKQDITDTKASLSADEQFLMDLKERCATADKDYQERVKTRREESSAIADAIRFLSEDEARDLFSKTISLLQTDTATRRHLRVAASNSQKSTASSRVNMTRLRRRQASAALFAAAARQRHGGSAFSSNLHLAKLAMAAQLDEFAKVKEMMDKMVVELKKQLKEEYEKHEACKKDIGENEGQIRGKESEKKDLEASIAGHEGALAVLTQELEDLNDEAEATKVALKSASEQRQAENHEFQQAVADSRATVAILKKALARLQEFYEASELQEKSSGKVHAAPKKNSFLFLATKTEIVHTGPPPPPAGKAYSTSGGAPGVMQLLAKIIQDAEKSDQEAVAAESESQAAYEQFVKDTNAVLAANEKGVSDRTTVKSQTEAEKLLAARDLEANSAALGSLDGASKALHLDCDFLLNNFNLRQQARQDEIDAIGEAKAILSGASLASS